MFKIKYRIKEYSDGTWDAFEKNWYWPFYTKLNYWPYYSRAGVMSYLSIHTNHGKAEPTVIYEEDV